MFIFFYQGASKQCKHQTKTAVFLTTRHFIPNFYFKINKTYVKDDLTITRSITYCIENKTKSHNEMKNKQFQHLKLF